MFYNDFKKLNEEEQLNFKNNFIHDLCDLNLPNEVILEKYNISYSTFRKIKKEFNVKRSKEDENKLRSKSIKEKMPETLNKIQQTKLERYGDKNYRNDEKIKQTNLERYGVENVYASEYVKEKKKQTYNKNYGTDHPMKNKEYVKQYSKNRRIKNNGEWNNNISKILQTKLEKYGKNQPEIVDKIKSTKLERYGNETYVNSEKAKETWNKKSIDEKDKIGEKRIHTCLEKYGIENAWALSKHSSKSKINMLFGNLLNDFNIIYEQEFNLKNKRFDFKVNDTLIEINPSYTHNSTFPAIFFKSDYDKLPMDKNYHLNKLLLAKENGFKCIHIWDWDDWNKIINLLISKQIIYARNCELKEVSKLECDLFLNLYHLQGTCNNQLIRLGLYYNNELVQIMTFGKPRYNKNYEYELLRLCSHKNYKIVGGSEKLFKHFIRENNPKNIISYCDNSKFSGDVYKRLGMVLKSFGSPTVNWSKGKQRITNNLLKQRGFDQLFKTNYGKGTSNRKLMIEHDWLEIYDCGQSVYEWINK